VGEVRNAPTDAGRAGGSAASPRLNLAQQASARGARQEARGLAAAAALLVGVSAVRAVHAWRTDAFLDHVSGAWAGLAFDLSRGVFYRPLYASGHYGGTRFFPLQFALEAAALRLGAAPRATGFALVALAMLGLMLGSFAVLRRWGVARGLAASCAGLVLAAGAAQVGLLAVRGDALPAALSVAGLALGAGPGLRWRGPWGAALLFTLAFAAKETSVFALTALVLWWWWVGRRRAAVTMLALTLLGDVLVLGLIAWASRGRAFQVFVACASGGATLVDVLHSPVRLLGLVAADPGTAPFLTLGAAAALHGLRRRPPTLAVIYFATTALATLLIVGSPGTSVNHLLDLHVAALLVVGDWLAHEPIPLRRFAVLALTAGALIAVAPILQDLHQPKTAPAPDYDRLAEFVHCAPRPVLSENPWFPVLAGQRPYLLDGFMFRVVRQQHPRFAQPLWTRLAAGGFGAVILRADPRSDSGQAWYRNMHFGPGFLDQLNAHYRWAATLGGQYIYLPRGVAGAPGAACLAPLAPASVTR